jgi:hypothetical protein
MLKRLVAVLVFVGPPAAAAEGAAQFSIGGVAMTTPVPAGYCLPQGPQIQAVKTVAAGDARNVTHLALLECAAPGGQIASYILLKTPNEAVNATLDLDRFLADAGAAFESPAFKEMLDSGKLHDESEASMGKAMGAKIDLAGAVRPLGKDERCAYLGGVMQVTSATSDYKISIGMCMTVVAGRLLTINWYGPDKGSAGVGELLVKAKRLAAGIRGAAAR